MRVLAFVFSTCLSLFCVLPAVACDYGAQSFTAPLQLNYAPVAAFSAPVMPYVPVQQLQSTYIAPVRQQVIQRVVAKPVIQRQKVVERVEVAPVVKEKIKIRRQVLPVRSKVKSVQQVQNIVTY